MALAARGLGDNRSMSVSAGVLRLHIDYTAWASLRLVAAASRLSPEGLNHDFRTADRSILETLVHVFAADRLWLSRLAGAPDPGFVGDADRSLAALESAWPAVLDSWQKWAGELTGAMALGDVAYIDRAGRSWNQPLWQLVLHVVNHGTHHRGQVAGFLRALGHTPPVLDLTCFYRERA